MIIPDGYALVPAPIAAAGEPGRRPLIGVFPANIRNRNNPQGSLRYVDETGRLLDAEGAMLAGPVDVRDGVLASGGVSSPSLTPALL